MGRGRFELPTPALSEQCSNQLSYQPNKKGKGKEEVCLDFETVQSHLFVKFPEGKLRLKRLQIEDLSVSFSFQSERR